MIYLIAIQQPKDKKTRLRIRKKKQRKPKEEREARTSYVEMVRAVWVAAAMYLALSAICLFMHMSDMSRFLAYINFICTVFASNIIESFYVCEHRAPSFFCHLIFVFVSFGFASYATLVLKINEKAYQNCDNVSKIPYLLTWK